MKNKKYLQTDEVLSKDSAAEVEDGKTPGPMMEVRFWEAKCMNLESLFEQVIQRQDKRSSGNHFEFR